MGSVNWNGAFSPTFQKSIGTVRFVPLADMGDKDWMILEYPNLRTTAKNRIADLIVNDDLVGFFHVSVLRKAKSNKLDYYWPASKRMVERFGRNMEGGDAEFFRNEPDTDTKTSSTEWVDKTIRILDTKSLMPTVALLALYGYIVYEITNDDNERLVQNIEPTFDAIRLDDTPRNEIDYEVWLMFIVLGIKTIGFEDLDRLYKDISNGRVPPEIQPFVRTS